MGWGWDAELVGDDRGRRHLVVGLLLLLLLGFHRLG